jgi:hypothetical protein
VRCATDSLPVKFVKTSNFVWLCFSFLSVVASELISYIYRLTCIQILVFMNPRLVESYICRVSTAGHRMFYMWGWLIRAVGKDMGKIDRSLF